MQGKPDLSSFGNVNEIEYGMGPDEPPTSVKIKEQFQRQILYNMSPKEVIIQFFLFIRSSYLLHSPQPSSLNE
jgi:hypothetical protein